jgi:hypothetical protein
MTTGQFWASAMERAVKTSAQVAAALVGTGAVGVTSLDWAQIGSVAAGAAFASVLMSLASDRVGPTAGPSLVGEALPDPETPAPWPAPVAPFGDPLPAAVDDDELARRQNNDIA